MEEAVGGDQLDEPGQGLATKPSFRRFVVLMEGVRHRYSASTLRAEVVYPFTWSHYCGPHVRNRGVRRLAVGTRRRGRGSRRLEYRGYDSAGVAVLVGRQAARPPSGPASWPTCEKALAERPTPGRRAGATGIGHTRWATHGAPTDRNAHPHLTAPAAGRRGPQRHHRELRRAARRARGRRASSSLSDTDTEVVAHLLEARAVAARAPATWPRRCARVCRRLEGAFTLRRGRRRATRTWSSARAATRRWWSGVGDGENFLASDVRRVHRAHPRRDRAGPGPGRRASAGTASRSPTSTATRPTASDYHVDWDVVGRREGRLRLLHAQGDRRAAAAPSPTRCSAGIGADGRAHARRDAADRRRSCATSTRSSSSPAARRTTPGWSPSTPSSTGPGSRARSSWPASSATATRSSTRSTLVVAISPVRRDDGHADGACATPSEQRARVLAICNTNGSTIPRESDAVLYTHAGPEIAVASTKAFLTQLAAFYLVGAATSRRCAAPSTPTRSPRVVRAAAADAGRRSSRCLDDAWSRCASWPASWPTRRGGAVPRPARRLPGRAGGRAQAQGARLHARRGLRRRRAQARPDRADRGGHCRSSCVVPSPRGRGLLHDKIVSNIQEVRARGARTIVIAEEGDEAVAPYADHAHPRAARRRRCSQPLVADRAAAGLRLRDRRGQRPRRRPAAQPRQVRHRRVERSL